MQIEAVIFKMDCSWDNWHLYTPHRCYIQASMTKSQMVTHDICDSWYHVDLKITEQRSCRSCWASLLSPSLLLFVPGCFNSEKSTLLQRINQNNWLDQEAGAQRPAYKCWTANKSAGRYWNIWFTPLPTPISSKFNSKGNAIIV